MPQAKVTGTRDIDDVGRTGCWQGCWLSWKLAKGGQEEWTWWCCVLEKVSCTCVPDASESVITVANGATPAGVGRMGAWKPITGPCDMVVKRRGCHMSVAGAAHVSTGPLSEGDGMRPGYG